MAELAVRGWARVNWRVYVDVYPMEREDAEREAEEIAVLVPEKVREEERIPIEKLFLDVVMAKVEVGN